MHQILLSRYFREELKQRIWGRELGEGPIAFCLAAFAFRKGVAGTGEGAVNAEDSQRFSSVQSHSLQPHESQHARPPCPSPTPGVYSNSCPSGCWCHPAISSSVVPFRSCPQPLPASGSFPMSQLFPWGGQSIGSFSFSISLSNEHPGLISFRMDWLDLLAVQGTLKSLLQHHSSKASILRHSAFSTV